MPILFHLLAIRVSMGRKAKEIVDQDHEPSYQVVSPPLLGNSRHSDCPGLLTVPVPLRRPSSVGCMRA